MAITNGSGRFVFRRLPKGSFGLTAIKPGYVEGAYGRSRPGGSSAMVELADGQRSDVVIPMWRFAALSGTVIDEAGEPLVGVDVRVRAALHRSVPKESLRAVQDPTCEPRGVPAPR